MSDSSTSTQTGGGCGCLGFIVAAVLSAALNHSFWWGLFHGICGWFYVLYALLVRSQEIIPSLRSMFGV